MEELDFSGLLACYSDQGRTGFNPIMLYAVVTYANMRGVRAVDRIVDLCRRDLAFIWLTKGQKPQWDVFYDFKGKSWQAKFWMNWITSSCAVWRRKDWSPWKNFKSMGQRSKRTPTDTCSSGGDTQLPSGWPAGHHWCPLYKVQCLPAGEWIRPEIRPRGSPDVCDRGNGKSPSCDWGKPETETDQTQEDFQ